MISAGRALKNLLAQLVHFLRETEAKGVISSYSEDLLKYGSLAFLFYIHMG